MGEGGLTVKQIWKKTRASNPQQTYGHSASRKAAMKSVEGGKKRAAEAAGSMSGLLQTKK